jgi:hypothetical protein
MAAMRNTMIVKYLKKSGLFETTLLTSANFDSLNDSLLRSELFYADRIIYYKYSDRYLLVRLIMNYKNKLKDFLSFESGRTKGYAVLKGSNLTTAGLDIVKSLFKLLKYFTDIFTVHRTYRLLLKKVDINKYDFIFSSYGPFIPHMIASRIKKKFSSIYWVADFRDPVFQVTTHKLLRKLYLRYPQSICINADLVTVVSRSIIKQLGFKVKKNFYHLTNGFDSHYIENFFKSSNVRHLENDGKLNIALTGTYYSNTNLKTLFKILNRLLLDNLLTSDKIFLHFYVNDFDQIYEHLMKYAPSIKFQFHKLVSRDLIFEKIISKFDLMLVLTYSYGESVDSVPGKLYEYLGLNKFVLGVVNGDKTNHELADIIEQTGAGFTLFDNDFDSTEKVTYFILSLIKKKQINYRPLTNNTISNINYSYEKIINAFLVDNLIKID